MNEWTKERHEQAKAIVSRCLDTSGMSAIMAAALAEIERLQAEVARLRENECRCHENEPAINTLDALVAVSGNIDMLCGCSGPCPCSEAHAGSDGACRMKVRVTVTKEYDVPDELPPADSEWIELICADPADFFDEATWTIKVVEDEVTP